MIEVRGRNPWLAGILVGIEVKNTMVRWLLSLQEGPTVQKTNKHPAGTDPAAEKNTCPFRLGWRVALHWGLFRLGVPSS